MTIYDELLKVTKVRPKKKDDAQSLAMRLAQSVDKLGDADWKRLSEPAQLWANGAIQSIEAGEAIDLPEGMNVEDDEPAEETQAEAEAEEDEVDEDEAEEEAEEDEAEEDEEEAEEEPEESPAPKKAARAKANGADKAAKSTPAKEAPKAAKRATKSEGNGTTKRERMLSMLKRKEGASVEEIAEEFGWLTHTTHGALSGLRKSSKLDSEKVEGRGRVYRIAE